MHASSLKQGLVNVVAVALVNYEETEVIIKINNSLSSLPVNSRCETPCPPVFER